MTQRHVALDGAVNFRDLGGYVTGDGHRTRWRVLFRADGLGDLSEKDMDVVRKLGIRTVVDLRSGHELDQSRFDTVVYPVDFHHIPFIDALPHADEWDLTPGLLGAQYKEMLDEATSQIVAALEVLTTPDAIPAVFHCTAGKDRTGLLAALVLSLVGVPEETVVADYALSGAAMERLRAKLIVKYPDGTDVINGLDEVFSAKPSNMIDLFVHLREHYGSVTGYAAAIGVTELVIGQLRALLLEPLP